MIQSLIEDTEIFYLSDALKVPLYEIMDLLIENVIYLNYIFMYYIYQILFKYCIYLYLER